MNPENTLSRALEDLSEVPGPESLADKALIRAKKNRINGYAVSTAGAFAAVAIIAVPFLLTSRGEQAPGGQFAAAAAPSSSPVASVNAVGQPCDAAPMVAPGVKQVAPQNWPAYVKATVDRLPARSDYVMQSGTVGVCEGQAYSVINLGEMREAGHVTVRLTTRPEEGAPVDCAGIEAANTNPEEPPRPEPLKVLFCDDQGGTFKLVYGIDDGYNSYRVYATYPDGRTVRMESIHDGIGSTPPTITAEQLRTVVTDRAMLAFFQ